MGNHIYTSKTNLAGAIKLPKSICFICTYQTVQYAGYTAVVCDKCGCSYDPFDLSMPDVVKIRRETMKLSRKELSKLSGLATGTIKFYENRKCSTPFFNLTKKLIRAKFRGVHIGAHNT